MKQRAGTRKPQQMEHRVPHSSTNSYVNHSLSALHRRGDGLMMTSKQYQKIKEFDHSLPYKHFLRLSRIIEKHKAQNRTHPPEQTPVSHTEIPLSSFPSL
ncbi:hypothetical protein QCA50_014151 [Cerrena zonata]|uniref:Uncharacterized protein n=1 Tax=Cerrena zonata TaxID=2478898 RepID=A0AAW0FP27_9APHY